MFHLSPKLIQLINTPTFVRSIPCRSTLYLGSRFISSTDVNPGAEPLPKKPRRLFRKLMLFCFLTAGTLSGFLYTSKMFRDALSSTHPAIAPLLSDIETQIGGWYVYSPKITAPDFYTSSKPVEHAVPTVPEFPVVDVPVVQPKKESYKSQPNLTESDIPTFCQKTRAAVEKAASKLWEVQSITNDYTEALHKAMSEYKSSSKSDNWASVAKLDNKKLKAEAEMQQLVEEANHQLQQLRYSIDHINDSDKAYDESTVTEAVKFYGRWKYNLTESINELQKSQNDLAMLKHYRDLTSNTHADLHEDVNALLRQVTPQPPSEKQTLTPDEQDEIIRLAHKQIATLQNKLNLAGMSEKARLKSALDSQKRVDDALSAQVVEMELENERIKHELDRRKWVHEARALADEELRKALARHTDHLSHMLQLEREKCEHQFSFRLREELAQQRVAFEAALNGWIKRMEAIEDVVDSRAELDKIAKETQHLWLACEALTSRLISTTPISESKITNKSWHTGPLKDYIDAIKQIALTGNHPFAVFILDNVPSDAAESGVWMEYGLKKRFQKVYKVCRRVALVDESSASLWTYALSYLQSLLVFNNSKDKYLQTLDSPNMVNEKEEPPFSTSDADHQSARPDTFCLLSSAKLALSTNSSDELNGDTLLPNDGIETAVRLLNQLQGQARAVADDWLKDAKLYLEAKQTSQLLLAYAAARGISTFQNRL